MFCGEIKRILLVIKVNAVISSGCLGDGVASVGSSDHAAWTVGMSYYCYVVTSSPQHVLHQGYVQSPWSHTPHTPGQENLREETQMYV